MELRMRLGALRRWFTIAYLKERVREWSRILLNPRLLFCLLLAWMITNGWSYIIFGLGMALDVNWMRIVGGAYMSFLWLPFTPEKLVTALIAVGLLRLLYPDDQQTLGVLRAKLKRLRNRP